MRAPPAWALDVLRPHVLAIGGKWFDRGDYNLNLIGCRTPGPTADMFDDVVVGAYKVAGIWQVSAWWATTDPGGSAREKPTNAKGVAQLPVGQYRGAWTIGKHQGKYPALRQAVPLTLDRLAPGRPTTQDTGMFGINWHASSQDPFVETTRLSPNRKVGRWSEGCVVLADAVDYAAEFWPMILQSAAVYGPSVTGTIVELPRQDRPVMARG